MNSQIHLLNVDLCELKNIFAIINIKRASMSSRKSWFLRCRIYLHIYNLFMCVLKCLCQSLFIYLFIFVYIMSLWFVCVGTSKKITKDNSFINILYFGTFFFSKLSKIVSNLIICHLLIRKQFVLIAFYL